MRGAGDRRQVGRRQRQAAAGVSVPVNVHPLSSEPLNPSIKRAAGHADAGRVLKLRRDQVPLIERRGPIFRVEILPVLRDGRAAHARARERRRVVGRAGASVYCAVAVSPFLSRRRS